MKLEEALKQADAVRRACESDPGLWNIVQAEREWLIFGDACDPLSPQAPEHGLKLLERDLYLDVWATALAQVPPHARVMVAGGGTGRFAQVLVQRGHQVDLVDASPEATQRARQHLGSAVTVSTGDIAQPATLANATYDLVLAVEVACYATEPIRVMERLRAALKPGGTLLFSVEASPGSLLADRDLASPEAVAAVLDTGTLTLPGLKHVHYFTRAGAAALAESVGLTVQAVEGVCYVPDGPFSALIDAGRLHEPEYAAQLKDIEQRCRSHPVLRELPRSWAVVARAA